MKPYEEYQTTEYDWLPEVPRHWEKRSIRTLTKLSDERNGNRDDLELLSVYREYGVVRKASRNDNHNVESLDLSNYKYVGKDYLVMNKMKMWQGSLGVSSFEGIVSPAYIVCLFSLDANYRYFQYLLRSPTFKTQYNRISYGIRVGQWDMRYNDFKNINLYIPSRPEQDQIVRFLDSKISAINKFVKDKKSEIELLKELKQVKINQAVTKGLDPHVSLKDSRVDWLGEIPKHWEVVQLRRAVEFVKTGITPKGAKEDSFDDNGFNWFTPTDFTEDILLSNSVRKLSITGKSEVPIFPAGTIMMIGIGGTMGKVSISHSICSCNQQINAILCGNRVDKYFLAYFLRSIKAHIFSIAMYTTLPILNQLGTKKINILLPPLNEQIQIRNFIEAEISRIDKAILKIGNEINLINEYKTSLISEVVTGKIDIREVKIDEVFESVTLEEVEAETEEVMEE
ncbi:MAG: restriction endonuclease subunit S [Bacteroidota bacterium]